jgi:hypothetical protein
MYCPACKKDVHPVADLAESGAIINVCPVAECKLALGVVNAEPPPPPPITLVHGQQHPGAAGGDATTSVATSSPGRIRMPAPNKPLDLVAEAKARLDFINDELKTLAALQREKRRLEAMIAAAEAADETDLPQAAE